jgi:hypothetical protein
MRLHNHELLTHVRQLPGRAGARRQGAGPQRLVGLACRATAALLLDSSTYALTQQAAVLNRAVRRTLHCTIACMCSFQELCAALSTEPGNIAAPRRQRSTCASQGSTGRSCGLAASPQTRRRRWATSSCAARTRSSRPMASPAARSRARRCAARSALASDLSARSALAACEKFKVSLQLKRACLVDSLACTALRA